MTGCGEPADGPGPWHLDLREQLVRQARRLASGRSLAPAGAAPTTAPPSIVTGPRRVWTAAWWPIWAWPDRI